MHSQQNCDDPGNVRGNQPPPTHGSRADRRSGGPRGLVLSLSFCIKFSISTLSFFRPKPESSRKLCLCSSTCGRFPFARTRRAPVSSWGSTSPEHSTAPTQNKHHYHHLGCIPIKYSVLHVQSNDGFRLFSRCAVLPQHRCPPIIPRHQRDGGEQRLFPLHSSLSLGAFGFLKLPEVSCRWGCSLCCGWAAVTWRPGLAANSSNGSVCPKYCGLRIHPSLRKPQQQAHGRWEPRIS